MTEKSSYKILFLEIRDIFAVKFKTMQFIGATY